VILLDSITRLGRAYNTWSVIRQGVDGGVDANALQRPNASSAPRATSRKAARSHHRDRAGRYRQPHGRSDFREFKGTGNSELILDRKSRTSAPSRHRYLAFRHPQGRADHRSAAPEEDVRAAPDPQSDGTMDAIDFLLDKLRNTKNNSEFFESMNT